MFLVNTKNFNTSSSCTISFLYIGLGVCVINSKTFSKGFKDIGVTYKPRSVTS